MPGLDLLAEDELEGGGEGWVLGFQGRDDGFVEGVE